MLFNSIEFALFLPIVFFIYWFVAENKSQQNITIVVSSYFFYGFWDWRFLILIFLSTLVDFFVGEKLSICSMPTKRKLLLLFSIFFNLGTLVIFKYYNFFIDSFTSAISFFGFKIEKYTLNIILPVGISFYTFQTLSYTIDVYKKRIPVTKNFIVFSSFVSYFPQLVAGPIERASNLLPQFSTKRSFNYLKSIDGLKQMLWGLFKKVVIADNLAFFVNNIFTNSESMNASSLLIGAVFFSFQIYCDFSGYSDIAIGTSRLFGINLNKNFSYPLFSRDFAEFWRRWHISLTNWFRDYLFLPMIKSSNKNSTFRKVKIIIIQFLIIGLWHGANWTFIVWGLINAIYFIPTILRKKRNKNIGVIAKGKIIPPLKEIKSIGITFSLFVLSLIFFRAQNITKAFSYFKGLFSISILSKPNFIGFNTALVITIITILFFTIEWIGRESNYAIEKLGYSWKRPYRYIMYYLLVLMIFILKGPKEEFIYFQF